MSEDVSNSRMNSRTAPSPQAFRSSEVVGESSSRPRGKIRQFLGNVKNGVTEKIRLKDSRRREPVPQVWGPNVQDSAPYSVEQVADPQSVDTALRDIHDATDHMDALWGPARTVASSAQNALLDLATADDIEATYLQPLRIFDSVIATIADVHPYAKMALGVLSCASKVILAQADRDEAVLRLLKKLGQVYDFITQDETLRQISSMQTIVGRIAQQTLECSQFIRDYARIKNFWKRLRKNILSETNDTIQRYSDVLDALMQQFRDQVARDLAIYVHRTGETLDLSGIAIAAGTGRDTRKQCLPGTRKEILSEITEWIYSSGDAVPRVLWLSGPAGKGKSAIAHTIANWFHDVGGLGSCYCFDRHRDADRRHEKVFSTIARDLADRDLGMRRALADAVQMESALKNTVDIVQQWQKFLIEPLGKLSGSIVGPVVILIDALDESGGVQTRSDLLRILAGKLQKSNVPQINELPNNFRFIVTSRPLHDIDDEFAGAQHIRRMSMDDIPPEIAERDIYSYVSNRLEGLSDFGNREFTALAEKADGVFEWARLACESIKTPPAGFSRRDSFDAVVSRDPSKPENLLYDMYHFILAEIMRKDKHTNAAFQQTQLARFRSVMGQILGAVEPLSLASLNAMRSHFPDQKEHYKVDVMLGHMGSLLSGTTNSSTPIRPLHTSFRDFLTNQSFSGVFFVDVSKVQRDFAFASLRVMERGLSFNICNLKSSYLPNCEDLQLPERIQKYIPPHLSYSCRFWAAHARKTDFDKELASEIKSFFDHERLLFWLELLGLIGALSGAVSTLPLIAQWTKSHSGFKDIESTAIDVRRFIQIFGSIISHSTPHLYVSALPFSPINSALSRKFSAQFPNTLRLARGRDLNWLAVQTVLSGHTDTINSVSFSPDGSRIVTCSDDNTIRLWDAAMGEPVGKPLRGHTDSVNSVSFSRDGTRIVTGSWDYTVRLWDTATGQPIGEPLRGHTDSVYSVSFSPDGTLIVSGSRDETVRLWDAATGQPVGEPLRGHTDSVNSVSFSPDGTRIMSGSGDMTVRLWDATTGQPVGEPLQGHTGTITSASFSPDGTRIVTGSSDNTVWLWDTGTGLPVGEPWWGHTGRVMSVSFSPDGTRVVSGSSDNTVRLWDVTTGEPVGRPLQGHTHWVNSVSFSPDGTCIVTGSSDKTVWLWDTATGQPAGKPPRGHSAPVQSVSFSPDGTRLVSGSMDNTVRLWDVATGEPVGRPLQGHTHRVNSVSFSPDGTRVVSGSLDCTIRLWDIATGQPIGEPLRGHTGSVNSVSFSLDGTRIVTGSQDRTVRLWDIATGQPVGEPLQGHTSAVKSVSFSPDGTCIMSCSWDHTVQLWDAAAGLPVGEPLRLPNVGRVHSASFSPDGTRIITASHGDTVKVWDTATRQPVGGPLLQGHTFVVSAISFSPDGTHFVTGSHDGTVRLWDSVTGLPVGEPLRGHTDWVESAAFSSDGTRIVSGSRDGTLRVWYTALGKPFQDCTETDCPGLPPYGSHTTHPTEITPTITPNAVNNNFISFSSNSTHALHDAAELVEGTSFDDRRLISFSLGDDGWLLGPNRRLLFWVPPASREAFSYNPWTALVIPRRGLELDLSYMAHGRHWQNCRNECPQ